MERTVHYDQTKKKTRTKEREKGESRERERMRRKGRSEVMAAKKSVHKLPLERLLLHRSIRIDYIFIDLTVTFISHFLLLSSRFFHLSILTNFSLLENGKGGFPFILRGRRSPIQVDGERNKRERKIGKGNREVKKRRAFKQTGLDMKEMKERRIMDP